MANRLTYVLRRIKPQERVMRVGIFGRARRLLDRYLVECSRSILKRRGFFVSRHQPGVRERKIVLKRLVNQFGNSVLSGPFAGMRVALNEATWGDGGVLVKLLGTVEQECWSSVEKLISLKPSQFVNLGCAEGYYAVGFATRSPNTPVIAIDIGASALQATRHNAGLNGVESSIQCFSSLEEAAPILSEGAAWVVDVEGAEEALLKPSLYRSLRSSTLLVETHEGVAGPTRDVLENTFRTTHTITEIHSGSRNPNEFDFLKQMADSLKWVAMSEGRQNAQTWLFLEPRL